MIKSEKELLDYIIFYGPLDAIVVEGYDGVGKGRVLNLLSDFLSVVPYRPDYNLWQKYDHRNIDRWKVSGFFWDVYSHFNTSGDRKVPMLFDRGVMSGAVYNHDDTIAEDYKNLLRDMRVLHILVSCDEEDYIKFAEIRKSISTVDYKIYEEFTEEYKRLFELAGVDYVVYENHYDESLSKQLSNTCEGCGHYNYGYCRHPKINCTVDSGNERCSFSRDKETQDMEGE